jgi:hypothetical protein
MGVPVMREGQVDLEGRDLFYGIGGQKGEVLFHFKRRRAARAIKGVRVENARWMGNLLKSSAELIQYAIKHSIAGA